MFCPTQESDITDKESKLDHHQQHQQQSAECSDVTEKPSTTDQDAPAEANKPPVESFRHILYIQMQLCAQKTIGDLLCNMSERQGNAASGVDIPQALKLFQQIAQAVHYVHTQGLIHRDLKPANCFVDESGNVQVGDFGLSRESSDRLNKKGAAFLRASSLDMAESIDTDNVDHTAGVGTRSYASPEQMNGSDYDSSTDVSI
jgi:serine/threonine protein kinase